MHMTILTPTLNSSHHLQGCLASVRSQSTEKTGLTIHHHIQDGGSTDNTPVIIEAHSGKTNGYCLSFKIEPDLGMYDALNRAFASTSGEIVGQINSDEQYLPGALEFVGTWFENHPEVDILFGAVVVVNQTGDYICSRMPILPRALHTCINHLCTFTAATFYRRAAIEALGTYFDASFATAGDADLILRMLEARLNMATTRRYLAVFINSGKNLSFSKRAFAENRRLAAKAPAWARQMPKLVVLHHRLRKLFGGAYILPPFKYTFIKSSGQAVTRRVIWPTGRWANQI